MNALTDELRRVREQRATQSVLRLERLVRTFRQGPRTIEVLVGASADIHPAEAVALVGPSGAGKSTLLHIAGLLETPDSGSVIVNGQDCSGMNDQQRTLIRRTQMGFVYQFHQLLPEFSALENVMIPQMIMGRNRKDAAAHARQLLMTMGLAERVTHRPAELSGGEQQRTAIARALANSPRLILADEPTGNLDPENAAEVIRHLAEFHRAGGTVMLVTHGTAAEIHADRILRLEQGRLLAN